MADLLRRTLMALLTSSSHWTTNALIFCPTILRGRDPTTLLTITSFVTAFIILIGHLTITSIWHLIRNRTSHLNGLIKSYDFPILTFVLDHRF